MDEETVKQIEELPKEYFPSAASPFISRAAVLKILRPDEPAFRKFDPSKETVESWLGQFEAGMTVGELLSFVLREEGQKD
jgi:hypothetical protein